MFKLTAFARASRADINWKDNGFFESPLELALSLDQFWEAHPNLHFNVLIQWNPTEDDFKDSLRIDSIATQGIISRTYGEDFKTEEQIRAALFGLLPA